MPPVVAFLTTVGSIFGLAGTAAAIAGAAAIVGTVVIAKALMPKIDMGVIDTDRARQTTVRSTIEPRKLVYGETMISGVVSFAQVNGANNKNLHQVIAIAGHKLTSIDKIFLDDYSIDLSTQVDGSGDVTSGKFAKKTNEDGTLETMVHIETRDGSASQTAYSDLVTAFAGTGLNAGKGYESTHRGDGVASIYTRWTIHEGTRETWDEVGGIQNIKAVVKGKAVYDPRLDVAAGNDAGDNPTTAAYIKYSDGATTATHQRDLQGQNPALMLADYLMDSSFGLGIPASKIDWAAVITAADACDFLVPIPTSQTQKRFFGSGVIFGSDNHRKSISKILSGMNGDLIYSQGKYIIKAGIHEASSLAFTEDDLAGDFTVKTSIPRADRFNTIKGMFIDPDSNYKMTEFSPRTVSGAVARDNGEVLEEEIKLTFTSDRYVAQRIAIKKVNQSFLQTTLNLPVNLKGMKVAVGDRITLALNDFATIDADWNPSKEFKVIGWSFSESGNGAIDLSLIEDDSARYADPAEGEYNQISNTGVITSSLADVPLPTNFTATAGYNSVNLAWTNPTNIGAWEQIWIYASDTTTPPATPIEKFRGTAFTHQIAGGTAKYYWIQAVKYPLGSTPASGSANTSKSALVPFGSPTAVTALKIANAVMADDSINTAQIVSEAVGSAEIATALESDNWSVPNQTGWRIEKSGDTTFNNTVIRGNISASTGSIGGITVDADSIHVGTGTFNNANTAFYADDAGQFSLKDKLSWDGSALTVSGAITATSGTFTGTVNASSGAFTGDVSTNSKFVAGSGATSATMDGGDQNYRIYAGGTTPDLSSFKVDSDGVVTATRLVVTRPGDLSAVIFDSARDGLVGIGLSSISQDTGIVVQAPAVELTSQTNTVSVVLNASQTLTLETILALPTAKKNAGNYSTSKYPASITATMQYSTNSGSSWSTFGAAVVLTRTATTSPSDSSKFGVLTQAVDGNGATGYRRDVHAIDNINNIHFIKSVSGFAAGSYLFRVQLSFVAGSSPDTDYEPNITGNRTLQFGTDGAGFTVDEFGVITDSASGTATIGYVQANYVALDNGNTITVGSGQTNTFEDTSNNEVLVVSDTEVIARNLFRATWNGAQPTSTKIIRVTNAAGNAERFSVTEAGDMAAASLTLSGDLTVNGTTTTVDTDNLTVKDNNITLNYSTGDSSSTANNAGITIQDAVNASTDASILWKTAIDIFEFSHGANFGGVISTPQLTNISTSTPDTAGDGRGFSFHYMNTSANPSPAGTDHSLLTMAYSNAWQTQIAQDWRNDGRIFIRGQNNSAWSSWHQVWSADDFPNNSANWDAAYTYSQVGHLPLAGGTLTGNLNVEKSGADSIVDVLGNSSYDPVLNLRSDQGSIASEGFQIWYDNSVGDVHLHTTYNNDVAAIRFHTRTGASKSTSNERFTINGNGLINITTGNLAMNGSTVISNDRSIDATSIETSGSYSGGSGDMTNVTNPQLKIVSAGTSDYWRIPHFSQSSTVSGVYNYQTGKNVFWGENSDTGTYYFRGRDLEVENITTKNITAVGAGNAPFALTGSSTILYLNIGSATQTSYTGMQFITDDGDAQFFKAGSTYSSWGGADAFNIYNSNGPLAFHPSATQNVLKLTSTEIIANRTVTGVQYSASRSAIYSATTQGTVEGALHLGPSLTTAHAGSAITFGASDSGGGATAQAGIYTRTDGTYGTELYFSTTDSYTTGPKTAISIDAAGNTNIVRGSFTSSGTLQSDDITIKGGTGTTTESSLTFENYADTAHLKSKYTDPSATTETYLAFHTNKAGEANGTVSESMRLSGNDLSVNGAISSGAITSSGNITTTANGSFALLQGSGIGVNNTSETTKYGIALYGGSGSSTNPTYGMMFTGTAGSGTHGSVTGSWATYFTMNSSAGRGWIFRDVTNGNKASISNQGNATFDGSVYFGSELHGSSKRIFTTSDSYLRMNQSNEFSSGLWIGSSNIMTSSGYIAAGSNGGTTTSRVYIKSGAYNGLNVIAIDGTDGSISAASGTFSGNVILGGTATSNPYANAGSKLTFGGGSDLANYSISTSLENFGGNYSKLDLRWHTGIRMGAQGVYGGIRFYNNEDFTSKLMSIGEGSGVTDVKVYNNLNLSAATNTASGIANSRLINVYGSSQQHASVIVEGNVGTSFLVMNSGLSATNSPSLYFNHGLRFATATNKDSTGFAERFRVDSSGATPTFLQRDASNAGHFVGTYNNVGANGLHSNPIYTIGSAYNPALDTLGNMYGVGYCSASASFISFTGQSNWGLYVAADGDARVWLDGSNGNISSKGSIYADGSLTTGGDIQVNGNQVRTAAVASRVKFSVWSGDTYGIGMDTGYTFGPINNNYVMSFQMSNTSDRGFWWGDASHTNAQGAMALSTDGYLTVASGARIGYGESDTVHPVAGLQVNGTITASTGSLSYIDTAIGNYGTIKVDDDRGVSWAGYAIRDDWVFMSSGAAASGIYNDTNNQWSILFRQSAEVEIYYNGAERFATTSLGVEVHGYHLINQTSSTRDRGVYGTYDPTKIAAIWSMGTAYNIATNGSTGGDLYGLCYSYNPDYGGAGNNPGAIAGLDHQMQWRSNGATHTAIGNGIYTIGNVTAYSDRRVKANIQHIPNALEKVNQINGYTYDRTDLGFDEATGESKTVRQTGVIAQELLEVLPEAVTGSEKDHYAVAYGNLAGLFVEAIKELTAKVEYLEHKLKEK